MLPKYLIIYSFYSLNFLYSVKKSPTADVALNTCCSTSLHFKYEDKAIMLILILIYSILYLYCIIWCSIICFYFFCMRCLSCSQDLFLSGLFYDRCWICEIYVHMYVHMYVCVCVYVCMYVCMHHYENLKSRNFCLFLLVKRSYVAHFDISEPATVNTCSGFQMRWLQATFVAAAKSVHGQSTRCQKVVCLNL